MRSRHVQEAVARWPYDNLGWARLDTHRRHRRGYPEVVLAEGKTPQQLIRIVQRFAARREPLLVTRLTPALFDALQSSCPRLQYHPLARVAMARRRMRRTLRGFVPVVTAGAGESLFVFSSGERLARAMRLDKLLRVKTAPISVSLPWGFNVGAVGLLPYLPLPTKLVTRVLPAMRPTEGETPSDFAARVQTAMQEALTALTAHRVPLIG